MHVRAVLLNVSAWTLLLSSHPAWSQSDPANFDNVTSYPYEILGNLITGPVPTIELSFAGTTSQFNFNAGSSSINNSVSEIGNEINIYAGATVENLTLGDGNVVNVLGGDLLGGLTLAGAAWPSELNLLSGGFGGGLSLQSQSRATLRSGSGLDVLVAELAYADIGLGADLAALALEGAGSATVSGGTIGPTTVVDSARVTTTGGDFTNTFDIVNDAFVNIAGGSFDAIDVDVLNDVNIAGGFIHSLEVTSVSAKVNISGGQFGDGTFLAGFDAEVNIKGGQFGRDLQIEDDAVVTISGGTTGPDVDVDDNATLNLVGTQFLLDGADVTAAVAAAGPGGLAIDSTSPPMVIEAVLADGSNVSFAFVAEAQMLGDEVSTLDPNANVNLVLGAAPLAGDYNSDGQVDAADYTVWRNHLGERSEANLGFQGDGLHGVDEADFVVWRDQLGATSQAAVAAVTPEPLTELLAFVVGGATAVVRRRDRRGNPPESRSLAHRDWIRQVNRVDRHAPSTSPAA